MTKNEFTLSNKSSKICPDKITRTTLLKIFPSNGQAIKNIRPNQTKNTNEPINYTIRVKIRSVESIHLNYRI